MAQAAQQQIPLRKFGKANASVSALGFGGHHLGDIEEESEALKFLSAALDGGVTFLDNCWEYHRGKCEEWMGKGIKGRRDKVFLMTKVCTHGRDKALAMQMLEESLRRLQTDHLDLWQVHGVVFENDPDLFIRPGGAAEALTEAKRQGKVRFVGFTGHKDPGVHLKMLKTGFPFDSVQMPLNPFDANFDLSFEREVLPEVNRRGMAAIGMKPMCGKGEPIRKGLLSGEEMLRYAMSLPVTTTITGLDKPEVLEQAMKVAQGFRPMTPAEMQALRDRVKKQSGDARFEAYKVSLRYDNPEARLSHRFPLDMKQKEVQEMLGASKNNGKPYPKYGEEQ